MFSTLCLISARALQEHETGSSGSVMTSDT